MPTIDANGMTIHYEVSGAGEPLLLLHGLGSCGDDWQLQVPVFAWHYQVVTADMRGHGRPSKPPGPYSVPMMAADVLALLDALEIKDAHIVGLSMGGMIAFQLAVDQPGRVRSLIIVNSVAALVPRTLSEKCLVWARVALARLFGPAATARFLSRRLFPKPEQTIFRERLERQWATNDRQAYLAAMDALVGWSVMDRIHQIPCSVLVISGDRDYLSADAKLECTRLMPDARFITVEDSGHATPIDQFVIFNRLVLDFLSEVDTRYPTDDG
ncbi:MAG: alpha/beta hydrolase [Chloroflexota bacterium]